MFIRWGDTSYKWGDPNTTWGAEVIPFERSVRLLDNTGRVLCILDKYLPECNWTFNRQGGCGAGSITISREFEELYDVCADYRIEIYINGEEDATVAKIYTGYIVDKQMSIEDPTKIILKTAGFSNQLNRVLIGTFEPYDKTGQTIKAIVTDLYDTFIKNKTDILWNAGLIDTPSYVPERIYYDGVKAWDAIASLAQITGEDYEFGVDKDRYLYFRARSATIQHFWFSRGVNKYSEIESFENISNRVLVKAVNYKDTFERISDYGSIASQVAEGSNLDCGTTARQKIKQAFTAPNASISRITAKMVAGGGVGWTDRITDGDMEASGVANWAAVGTGTITEKSTAEYRSATQSLYVKTGLPDKGTEHTMTSLPDGHYTLFFNYKIISGDLRLYVVDSAGNELAKSDRFTRKDSGGKWSDGSLSFTVAGSPASVTLRIYNDLWWVSTFHIDEVHCYKHQALLKAYLANNSTPLIPIPGSKIITFPIIDLGGEVSFDFHYFGCEYDGITTYALVLEPDGTTDNATYFQFIYNTSAAIAGGALSYYNGSTWSSVTGCLTIQIYYNQSQEIYGLRDEIAPSLPNDIDIIRNWTSSYLSGKDRAQKRSNFSLVSMRYVLDSAVPTTGIGLISFRDEGGTPFPSQLLYPLSLRLRMSAATHFFAQPFTHNHDFTVISLALRLQKVGTPTGNIFISIHEDDGGKPAATALATSAAIDVATISTTAGNVIATFADQPKYRKNALYWWKATGTYTVSSSNCVRFYCSEVLNGAGIMISDVAAVTPTHSDFTFKTTGVEVYEAQDIVTANYSITDNGMNIDINAGSQLPDLAKLLKRIEFEIQSRTSDLLY